MSDCKLYPPLAALRAFEAVGRLGGIRKAARELDIDHTVVSRHLRALESLLSVSLVDRDGGGISLTASGRSFHGEIYQGLRSIANATGKLIEGGEAQQLHIWCIPGFATLWLADHLNGFMAAHPDIVVDFRPADYSPDFRFKEVSGDIRYLRPWEVLKLPSMVRTVEFARPNVFPVASAEFLRQARNIDTAADLLSLPLLHEDNDLEWRNWFTLQGVPDPSSLPGPRLWHAHLTLNAARQGQGVALANSMLLGHNPRDDGLVQVVPRSGSFKPVRFGGYTFIARDDQWNVPAIKRFRSWLQKIADLD